MINSKTFMANLVAGILGAFLVFGGAWGLGAFENDIIVEEGEVITVTGDQGIRGYTGAAGVTGPQGLVGPRGPQGDSTSVDIEALADAVVDELEDREDRINVTFTGGSGDKTKTLVILEDDSYEFKFRKYTSGDFEVSLEDEDGNVTELLDTTGHVNTEDVRHLEEGVWTIHISSEGSWKIEVEQL